MSPSRSVLTTAGRAALLGFLMVGCTSPRSPEPEVVTIAITTEVGVIIAELYPENAPGTVANFLQYVDTLAFDGGTFFRTVRDDNQGPEEVPIAVIQAGADSGRNRDYPPITIETTELTGLRHLDGMLSMARSEPNTARASFFICIGDQPELDFGGRRNPDGQGFAAFGRVVQGMELVRQIHAGQADGQGLTPPVTMLRIERIADQSPASNRSSTEDGSRP